MTFAHQALDLLAAAGLGGAIGLERELNAQPAGFRTHLLVGLGSALFTLVGADVTGSDPTRIAAQVVTGIGFLGAGAILHEGGSVRGLTTAASLWVTAAAGVACGLDRPGLAAFTISVALIALVALKVLEKDVFPRRRGHRVLLEISETADAKMVVAEAKDLLGGAVVRSVDRAGRDGTAIILSSPLRKGSDLLTLAIDLRALDGVVGVELGQ